MNLIKPGTNIDFVGKRKYAAAVSFILVVISLLLFIVKGPNWGIDFTGGTEIHLKFHEPTEIGEIRTALAVLDLSGDAVQQVDDPDAGEYVIRIQDPTYGTQEVQGDVTNALVARFGEGWIEETVFDAQVGARMTVRYTGDALPIADIQAAVAGVDGAQVQDAMDDNTVYIKIPGIAGKISQAIKDTLQGRKFEVTKVDSVGPKVGGELRLQGLIAIFATLALVLVYVAFRFDLAFAPGAVLALFHDVVITVGIFVVTRHEFNLPMIGALLTIVGYSLNDTIVIYDRVRENMTRYRRRDMAVLINDSVNETLGRTLATALTTIMAMSTFLLLGGPVIETFALAIILGIIFGTYSTVYVASPSILVMQDLRPMLEGWFAPLASKKDPGAAVVSGDESAAARRRRERRERRDATNAPTASGDAR